jgi:oligopeptide/dipeptide ABC transporter ATP-binding protein
MRQRVMIAMALACKPDVLIADEPTTALDVTVQAQIFDLLRSVGEETGAGIILITHDMGSIAEIADRVLVMYAGHMVETGSVDQVLTAPAHPYTQGLIACVPHVRAGLVGDPPPLVEIPGIVPSMTEPIEGCPFAPRCAHRMSRCREALPPPIWKERGHQVACFLNDESHAEPEASSHRAGTPC